MTNDGCWLPNMPITDRRIGDTSILIDGNLPGFGALGSTLNGMGAAPPDSPAAGVKLNRTADDTVTRDGVVLRQTVESLVCWRSRLNGIPGLVEPDMTDAFAPTPTSGESKEAES